jgi:hypothetical protein
MVFSTKTDFVTVQILSCALATKALAARMASTYCQVAAPR